MGKYQSYTSRDTGSKNNKEIHPIWRGVGLVLIILTPILSYAAGLLLLQENQKNGWVAIPQELVVRGFSDPLILVKVLVTLVLMVFIYGLFSMITFVLYRSFAPPQYGPYDVPREAYRGKKYKR